MTAFIVTEYPAPDMHDWQASWVACYQDYLRHVFERSRSMHTTPAYAGVLTRFFDAVQLPPHQVTRRDVEAFASLPCLVGPREAKYVGDREPAARTRNHRIAVVASFYDYACSYEIISPRGVVPLADRNPASGVRYTATSPAHRTMTLEQFKQFISAIPQDGDLIHIRDTALFTTLFWTARRRAEICALTWGSIEATTFLVNPKTQETRSGWRYTYRAKGGSIVTAEMPQPAMQAILAYVQASERMMEPDTPLWAAIGPSQGGFVHDPFLGLSPAGLYERMKHYLRLAGMDEHAFSPHSVRHGAALARYRAGSGPMELMRVLNHKNLRTSQVYIEELDTAADVGAQLLAEQFGAF